MTARASCTATSSASPTASSSRSLGASTATCTLASGRPRSRASWSRRRARMTLRSPRTSSASSEQRDDGAYLTSWGYAEGRHSWKGGSLWCRSILDTPLGDVFPRTNRSRLMITKSRACQSQNQNTVRIQSLPTGRLRKGVPRAEKLCRLAAVCSATGGHWLPSR